MPLFHHIFTQCPIILTPALQLPLRGIFSKCAWNAQSSENLTLVTLNQAALYYTLKYE